MKISSAHIGFAVSGVIVLSGLPVIADNNPNELSIQVSQPATAAAGIQAKQTVPNVIRKPDPTKVFTVPDVPSQLHLGDRNFPVVSNNVLNFKDAPPPSAKYLIEGPYIAKKIYPIKVKNLPNKK